MSFKSATRHLANLTARAAHAGRVNVARIRSDGPEGASKILDYQENKAF